MRTISETGIAASETVYLVVQSIFCFLYKGDQYLKKMEVNANIEIQTLNLLDATFKR